MVAAAIAGSAVIGAGASMMAGRAQGKSAEAAAAMQAEATRESVAEQRRQFDLTRADFAPYRDVGQNALLEFSALYGIGRNGLLPMTAAEAGQQTAATAAPQTATAPSFTRRMMDRKQAQQLRSQGFTVRSVGDHSIDDGTNESIDLAYDVMDPFSARASISGGGAAGAAGTGGQSPVSRSMEEARNRFMETPGYQFRFDEGIRALDRSAAARGSLRGGAHERGLIRYGHGIGSEEFGNYANRLASLAGVGQSATGSTAAAGQASAGNISNILMTGAAGQGNALQNAATARASGYAGVGNAASGAVQNYLFHNALQNRSLSNADYL
jgi:hypothetical protein